MVWFLACRPRAAVSATDAASFGHSAALQQQQNTEQAIEDASAQKTLDQFLQAITA